jgi:subtilisin-like proprotein convertase family protein
VFIAGFRSLPRNWTIRFDENRSVEALEEVGVSLRIDHARRGEVEILLVSPSGTTGRLMRRYDSETDQTAAGIGAISDDGRPQPWTFWSHAFWGEKPLGEWTVIVRDTEKGTRGVVEAVQLHLRMGRLKLDGLDFKPCQLGQQILPELPSWKP